MPLPGHDASGNVFFAPVVGAVKGVDGVVWVAIRVQGVVMVWVLALAAD